MKANSMSEEMANYRAEKAILLHLKILGKIQALSECSLYGPAKADEMGVIGNTEQVAIAGPTDRTVLDPVLKQARPFCGLLCTQRFNEVR